MNEILESGIVIDGRPAVVGTGGANGNGLDGLN